jgi:phage anti-repressor protein
MEIKNRYTKIAYNYYILHPDNDLQNINTFVEITKIPIDKVWIDDFWRIINHKEWVIIDERRIKQIGYKDKQNKYSKIGNLLRKNFIEGEDYKLFHKKIAKITGKKQNGGQNRKMYEVTPETFKRMLMKTNTKKSDEIRTYFITVETLFLAYFEFQCLVKNYEYEKQIEKLKKLQHIRNFSRDNELKRIEDKLEHDIGVVYFIKEGKSKRYKVGFTHNLPERLKKLQTANSRELSVYKSFICHSSSILETIIHRDLKEYNIRGEWFKLDKSLIKSLIQKYR